MAPSSRPDSHLNLSYLPTGQPRSGTSTGSSSPSELQAPGSMKSAFGGSNGLVSAGGSIGSARRTAGSPSHELSARIYSKRAREIQAQEGVTPNIWGPPTSGNSTPLRENIPESPGQDEFPDLIPLPETNIQSPARRTRADTVPSRFSPVGPLNGVNVQSSINSKTSRPTPSTSPFRPPGLETPRTSAPGSGVLLSRLRAGSMPQRTTVLGNSNPFGPSLFSTNWASGRDRATTLTSIRSSEGPTSPSQSSFSRDGLADADVKTLDYLGLAETPQQTRATLARPADIMMQQQQQHQQHQQHQQQQQHQAPSLPPLLAELTMLNRGTNRFRSYSVNAKEKYAEDEEEFGAHYSGIPSGTLTPSAAATAAQLAATQAQIHQHNLAVQAFANQASASRPRARTAGVLDTPPQRSAIRNYLATPSRLDNSIGAADLRIAEAGEYDELQEAVQMMQLGGLGTMRPGQEVAEENNLEGPTRALWIGSIPVSTTVTSLDAIFSMYGKIESTRVLTHKNCGFVNFERVESAIQAKSLLNGKEIFPGAGPVRIGYAKVPVTPASETPGHSDSQSSPTPDPNASGQQGDGAAGSGKEEGRVDSPKIPELSKLLPEMAQIVTEFGASENECMHISQNIQRAISYQSFNDEIAPIPEPSQTRTFDAPKLRDIRKRIDNGACSVQEIEETAKAMLPEIAELSSDYLGNTVVQKLFEFCSEATKEEMLVPIAPHLAEIGVHKNGTWAAQKIIDVAKTHTQKQMIVESLRPYTVPLFLDQYGNYVLQCCLRFGPPYNDFIFETMLSRMWEIAQGRFGARAMRACLESHHATKDQQRMLASAIALHSVQLATNANGALLLTWFLDTCNFPHRRTVLAPRLVPHLVHLCTHKVAYLTVLKIVNQRNEPEAREIILKALFFSSGDETLENILKDQVSGATLIFKVLTTPFFEESMRAEVVKTVAKVLTKLKTSPSQGYKRLMDEVGLSSRNGPSRDTHHGRDHGNGQEKNQGRQPPRQPAANVPPQPERQYSGQFPPNIPPQSFNSPSNMARSVSSDHNLLPFDPYSLGGINTQVPLGNFNAMNAPGFSADPVNSLNPQVQYQNFLAAQSRGMSPQGAFYSGMPTNGFGGYPTNAPSIDAFRTMQTHSSPIPGPPAQLSTNPMMQQPAFAAPSQFSPITTPVMGAGQLYGYPQPFYQQPQPSQGSAPGGRRGRR
ncbi:RNA binding protein [Coccidioides immitis RMSCC 2394]|uniref:RNA binding protein n=1 Tax=Coccidioides immitis RMSCC 2394 TaxID=404692 RepID=A0A0J6Y200_COCIT|nr:RNA binding protein [Coccidioides immitis RMSCC 2394]